MPYIGNNHFAGDHINNFKVLDDISSYTATFDGSSSNVVSTTNETIRIPEHRFIQGQRVTYNNGGGSNIGGLSSGTAYYVSFDSANTVKLATSLANANDGTLINLSSVGGGTSHTLTAAFDGTNTKFKLTHNNGEGGRFNNATQLQVAINNVLQRPNLNSDNFTEGFAIESGNKIVFKTAPTSNDVFWGSIIANTLPTFDVSDNKIDTFTGDGSTTEFNLSHIPANNESLMVTINGVLQHPSNASTARAYTLIANVIQFTSAPASGDEIQVRHIGFRGATSSSVTGFYGRTGNVVLTSNDHITTGDITSRNVNIAGVSTFSDDVRVIDDKKLMVGNSGSDLYLKHISSSNYSQIAAAPALYIQSNDLKFKDFTNGDDYITAVRDGSVDLFYANSKKLETTSTGVNITGNLAVSGVLTYEDVTNIDSVGIVTARNGIDCNGDLDVDGHTNLDNVSIAGVTTASTINSTGNIEIDVDNGEFRCGAGGDFKISHNGSLNILRSDFPTVFRNAANNETLASFTPNGAVELYHDNVKKAYTVSNGFYITDTGKAAMARVIAPAGYDARIDLTADTHANEDNYRIEANTDQKFRVYGKPGGNYTSFIELDQVGKVTLTRDVDVARHLDVDGHTNLDNVSIAGVTTFASSIHVADSIIHEGDADTKIDFTTNVIKLTAANRLRIDLTSNGYNKFYGSNSSEADSTYPKGTGATYVHRFRDTSGDDTEVQFFNTNVKNTIISWNDTGNTSTAGNLLFKGVVGGSGVEHARFTGSGNFNLLRDLDVDGHTNLDNVSVAGITTFSDDVKLTVANGNGILLDKSASEFLINSGTYVRYQNNNEVNTDDGKIGTALFASGLNIVGSQTGSGLGRQIRLYGDLLTNNIKPTADSTYDIGTNSVRVRNVYADTLYGDGSNLSNVISGVDVKFEGASVGTGVTMLNFVGFNTVTAPVSGLSTITSGQNLTIGVRSGSAVEASLTGTSFNVIARSGGNISINI